MVQGVCSNDTKFRDTWIRDFVPITRYFPGRSESAQRIYPYLKNLHVLWSVQMFMDASFSNICWVESDFYHSYTWVE
jgi:hypothetical protein